MQSITCRKSSAPEQGLTEKEQGIAANPAVDRTRSPRPPIFQPGMDARLDDCAPPRRPPCRFDPSEIACVFLSAENGTFFHDKKPGAVTRPGICVTVTDIPFYMNLVTFVKHRMMLREVRASEGAAPTFVSPSDPTTIAPIRVIACARQAI